MAATLTTIDISEYQIDSKMDWPGLIAAGVTSVIIRLSHGHTQDTEAAAHIASAKKYNLPWHGYHFYEGSSGEVEYSANMATTLGLPSTSYLFLDFEDSDIGGDWSAQFYDFRNSWLAKGWKVGLYTGDYNYTHKGFDDDELTADGVYRWIASYSYEPANYDAWQYTSTGGLGNYTSNLDHDYDRTGKLSYVAPAVTNDPFEPPAPIAGSMVGIGFDSSPVGGDRSYGYTTDGKNFYAAITPWGFIFRQRDADRMWPLLKPKIGTIQGAKGDKGDKGDTGPAGKDGIQGPKGDTGAPGADGKDGAAATIAVGTVTTGAAGTSAAVTNAGTASAAKLNFTIPQGAKGDKGDPGTTANVTIDGRNYLLNSRLYTGQNMGSQGVTITYADFDVNTKMMHLTAAQSTSTSSGVYINDGQLSEHSQNGDHWVFSADMRGTGTLRTIWRENSTPVTESNLTLTDAWQRVSQMGTLVDSTKGSWCIYFDTTKGAVDAYIKLIKVERNATVASGWTPAPEDPIQIVDGRTTNSIPSWYIAHYPRQSVTEIKKWSVMGVKAADFPTGAAPSNQYCTVRTDVPWIDNSAGWPYQTIEISGEALPVIFVRVGISDSDWSAVKPITFW